MAASGEGEFVLERRGKVEREWVVARRRFVQRQW
jgi:hypothetical protein